MKSQSAYPACSTRLSRTLGSEWAVRGHAASAARAPSSRRPSRASADARSWAISYSSIAYPERSKFTTIETRSLSVPARGVRSTTGLVGGSGPQQPDPSTARDAGVTPVSPLSTALAGLVMVRIAVGLGLQQPANPETDHDHRQTAPCGAYREGV